MRNFFSRVLSYLKGEGIHDEYDIDDYLNTARTTKLQVVLILAIFIMLGITIKFVIPSFS